MHVVFGSVRSFEHRGEISRSQETLVTCTCTCHVHLHVHKCSQPNTRSINLSLFTMTAGETLSLRPPLADRHQCAISGRPSRGERTSKCATSNMGMAHAPHFCQVVNPVQRVGVPLRSSYCLPHCPLSFDTPSQSARASHAACASVSVAYLRRHRSAVLLPPRRPGPLWSAIST